MVLYYRGDIKYSIKLRSNQPIKTGFNNDACFPLKTIKSRSVVDPKVKFPSIRGKIVILIKKRLVFTQNLNIQIFIPKIFSDEVCQTLLCEVLLFLQTVRMAETIHGWFASVSLNECDLFVNGPVQCIALITLQSSAEFAYLYKRQFSDLFNIL